MSSDRQIAACNSTMICQRKIPSGTLPKPGICHCRKAIIISLLILIKPGMFDCMSQTSHTPAQTHNLSYFRS